MERKLGEIFTYNGKTYQVVKGFSCNGCTFIKDSNCDSINELLGPCDYTKRTDKTNVIFREINIMEQKLNIAEILRNKPEDTKLYSPIFGKCVFRYIKDETNDICVKTQYDEIRFFNFEGLYNAGGECLLFPSKEMQDWSKFQWEKGDVLISNDGGTEVIFDKWYDDTYTSFYCKHYLNSEDKNKIVYYEEFLCTTERYSLEDKDIAQTYINIIEKHLGGKLNLETLVVEKHQPEFKDGDVVALDTRYIDSDDVIVESFIVRGDYKYGDDLKFYAACSNNKETDVVYNSSIIINKTFTRKESLRLSTEEEKQQLFSALAKENKRWDAEKKQIVDLKPKIEFKPFDKVVVRDTEYSTWCADLFSHIDEDYRYACVGATWSFCIPYNEETAKLIGTTKNVEG